MFLLNRPTTYRDLHGNTCLCDIGRHHNLPYTFGRGVENLSLLLRRQTGVQWQDLILLRARQGRFKSIDTALDLHNTYRQVER